MAPGQNVASAEESVTVAEAEAALRALGPCLEWTDHDAVSFVDSEDESECYGIINEYDDNPDDLWESHVGMHRPADVSPFRYKTRDEAKAACEWHFATGKWERR